MSSITSFDKDRMMSHLRNWYRSHKQSIEHYQTENNQKATEYHQKQLENLEWMAKIIKSIEVEDGGDCPF